MEILVLIWLVSGVVCMLLAQGKNKNGGLAFVMGALFGIFAIIYYAACAAEPPAGS